LLDVRSEVLCDAQCRDVDWDAVREVIAERKHERVAAPAALIAAM
jgi:hypothetical protein